MLTMYLITVYVIGYVFINLNPFQLHAFGVNHRDVPVSICMRARIASIEGYSPETPLIRT